MKKNYKKRVAQSVLCMMLALCMVVCGMMISEPGTVQAATKGSENAGSGYKMLFNSMTGEDFPVKTGRYYVKQKYSNGSKGFSVNVYVSTKKKGGYKRIPYCHTASITTNGKYAYYRSGDPKKQKLYKYTYSTGKAECVGTLPSDKYYNVIYAYGYGVILSNGSASMTGEGNESLYEYNLKTKKLKTLWNKANRVYAVGMVAGKYVFVSGYNSDDEKKEENLLCEMTTNGLKVIKKLPKGPTGINYTTIYNDGENPYAPGLVVDNNKIYYRTISGKQNMIIYEFNKLTSKIKKVATMKFESRNWAYSDYAVAKFTSKYCIYRYNGTICRKVTYSTGKTVRVKYIDFIQ